MFSLKFRMEITYLRLYSHKIAFEGDVPTPCLIFQDDRGTRLPLVDLSNQFIIIALLVD